MNKIKSIAIIIGLSMIVLISLFGKKVNEKESIIVRDTETSTLSRVEVEEEQIIPTTEKTESDIGREEMNTNWFLTHVTEIDCYTVIQEEIDRIGQMDELLYLFLYINDNTVDLTPLGNLGYLKKLEICFFLRMGWDCVNNFSQI